MIALNFGLKIMFESVTLYW